MQLHFLEINRILTKDCKKISQSLYKSRYKHDEEPVEYLCYEDVHGNVLGIAG